MYRSNFYKRLAYRKKHFTDKPIIHKNKSNFFIFMDEFFPSLDSQMPRDIDQAPLPKTPDFLSLQLDATGQIIHDLALRNAEEIKLLQTNSQTIVVLPTAVASLFECELPNLSDNKLRAAIPFALEDYLSQPVDALHFAYYRQTDKNNYCVVVIDKGLISSVLEGLNAISLLVDCVTLDWFALKPSDVWVGESSLLVNQEDFKGALKPMAAINYLKKTPGLVTITSFIDSVTLTDYQPLLLKSQKVKLAVAEALSVNKPFNVCQGLLRTGKSYSEVLPWYKASAALLLVWLVSFVVLNAFNASLLSKKIAEVDTDIATRYRQFFPDAKQVINPRFRINQLMNSTLTLQDKAFWNVLSQFSKTFDDKKINLEALNYKNKVLTVTLVADNFSILEALQLALQKQSIQVTQKQASSRKLDVMATLELRA